MGIKEILSNSLGISKLTETSFKKAIAYYNQLPDKKKRLINREIAHFAINTIKTTRRNRKYENTKKIKLLLATRVLGINYAGPLDVTLEWTTQKDGNLNLIKCRVDSGGDQVNVSKVLSSFRENITLVALAGKKGKEITNEWERNFLSKHIIPELIRYTKEDQQAAIYNIIDGKQLPVMFGWADKLSRKTVENINQEALKMLQNMAKGNSDKIWVVLSAGGPLRYDKKLAYYSSLVRRIKQKYQDRVIFLLDFKFVSGPEEAMSVLNINRKTPQDIIKPNLEEFMQILISSGLVQRKAFNKNAITEDFIKKYALKLREKFNLLGVLVTMAQSGLILVMQNKIIKEKGIKIKQACPTGAGDALKAGILYALSNGKSFEEAVHYGNLFGAATASMEGTQTVTPKKLIEIKQLANLQNITPKVKYLK